MTHWSGRTMRGGSGGQLVCRIPCGGRAGESRLLRGRDQMARAGGWVKVDCGGMVGQCVEAAGLSGDV